MTSLFCSWFRWNVFSFSPFSMMLPIGLSYMDLEYVELCSLYVHFQEIFFVINWYWILSKSFTVFIGMVIWFLFFSFFMWYITEIDLWTLRTLYIPWMNSTWSWFMILLMYCLIWIASIFWRFLHLCSSVVLACNFVCVCVCVR